MSVNTFSQLADKVSFPKEEQKILEYWRKIDAFKTQLNKSKDCKPFTFYDGPPFATGTPHYGHILAGTIKDVICRYATQTGHYVERRFGWDTHGLPVEYEIEKDLGIKSREDVLKMGIKEYNKHCRSIVMRCADDWEITVERMGRWIDFKNDYKTLDKSFMESVWWVFSQIHKKGLVYRGYKVMPYSTALNTPLSNFEAKSNYKERQDPAIMVTFPIIGEENTHMIAWTTTPWTLPSNLALCVNEKLSYVKAQDPENGHFYIFGEKTLASVQKGRKQKLKIIATFKGKELVGKKYVPLFDYFKKEWPHAFFVVSDDYVGEAEGTAVVHQAPGFGEDDLRVCENWKIYQAGKEVPCPVDIQGKFTKQVHDYADQYVLDANKQIQKDLKDKGRLWSQSTIMHEYPYCWRSETPLIYRTIPSWFIKVTDILPNLLKSNEKTYWVPSYVKDKRFHNWLESARDWSVSRNRYWGTPLPIWMSKDEKEWEVISSVEELEKKATNLNGREIEDLHRENVDDIIIKSEKTGNLLYRVDEVFDCWFESGSMPYAQCHYPFEIDEKTFLSTRFPADFIAEGLDQTRGWFYTLLVISTALFDQPAWKHLIVNGLVLAEDGKKMSKRLKNYPDPHLIFDTYGADSLRLYLCNSPVVRAEPLRFSESGVHSVSKDVLSPWWNGYKFFIENAQRYERDTNTKFIYNDNIHKQVENIMDKWILSELQSLIKYVRNEMEGYRLYTVLPELVKFIDKLCNWYVRMNRSRLRGQTGLQDAKNSLGTLHNVLINLCQLMSPLTPFIVESMYLNLRHALGENSELSVHFLPIPSAKEEIIDLVIERRIRNLQKVIELGRNIRDINKLKIKQPLSECVIVNQSQEFLKDVESLQNYVETELNVKHVKFSNELGEYIKLTCEPDFRSLGQKFKSKAKELREALPKLTHDDLLKFVTNKKLIVSNEELTGEDIKIIWNFNGDNNKYVNANSGDCLVLLNKTIDEKLVLEGTAREISNRIQKLRKKGGLISADVVTVYYSLDDNNNNNNERKNNDEDNKNQIARAVEVNGDFIEKLTRVRILPYHYKSKYLGVIASEKTEVENEQITLYLCKPQVYFQPNALSKYDEKLRYGIELYVLSKDFSNLKRSYPEGSKLEFTIDEHSISLTAGVEFVYDASHLKQAKIN